MKSVGVISLWQITFIVLKLTNVINWSWFWVFTPVIIFLILTTILTIVLYSIFIKK